MDIKVIDKNGQHVPLHPKTGAETTYEALRAEFGSVVVFRLEPQFAAPPAEDTHPAALSDAAPDEASPGAGNDVEPSLAADSDADPENILPAPTQPANEIPSP